VNSGLLIDKIAYASTTTEGYANRRSCDSELLLIVQSFLRSNNSVVKNRDRPTVQ